MTEPDISKDSAIHILQRIREAAESALAAGVACVCLTVRRDSPPTASHVLLATHSGPRGELLNVMPDATGFRVVGRFRCAAVISWCTKTIATILQS